MVLRLSVLFLCIICANCSVPVTEKPHTTSIEVNEPTDANALVNREVNDLSNEKMWINNGIKVYNDTLSEIWYEETLTSSNFLKYLHPWESQFSTNWIDESGPIYFRGLYSELDQVVNFTEDNVDTYIAKIDSAHDYFMKNYLERGDVDSGMATLKSIVIIKSYLFAKVKNWDKAEELVIAESKLESSQYINLHSIAIPILYEKYGESKIMEEVAIIPSSETTQYIHGILFDLNVIRKRFRDKKMTWKAYFEMAFEHYEMYGID
ncbi:MAG: hypothetical protein GQ574_07625 [Crocinitomix sp.]|nr:hypothetical protein [Crocinitomix sp.]